MKCSTEQAEAIIRLRALPEWNVFMGMIAAHAEKVNRMLIMKDDVAVDIKRGELRLLTELVDAIDSAPEVVERAYEPKT